jgi:peptidoglycan/LPS O-acetylase OafA/YrhL
MSMITLIQASGVLTLKIGFHHGWYRMGMFRLFLATVVMLGHYDVIEVSLSTIAVCCFYIISGFYMQLLLFPSKVNVANFYISRALRIYPLYWTLTAVTFLTQASSDLWRLAARV